MASTSAEESVRAVLEHAVGERQRGAVRGVRRRHRPGQEAGPGDLPARARAARGRARRRDRDRGFAQRPARRGRRRAAVRRDGLELHRRRGHERGGARRHQPRRPGRARRGAGQSWRARSPASWSRSPTSTRAGPNPYSTRRLYERERAHPRGDGRAGHRPDRGRQRDLLLRARRRGRRRRFRLLARARLRGRARRLGRDGVHRRRRPAEEDRDRPQQAHRRHLRADLGDRIPARRRRAQRHPRAERRAGRRRDARRDRGDQAARQHRSRRQDAARRARPRRRRRSRPRSPTARASRSSELP